MYNKVLFLMPEALYMITCIRVETNKATKSEIIVLFVL